ncbi:NAD(P)H-binding protein [Amycolatopsis sp. NPDC059657]|uniref:NAD(P)H-binding protein n=1 Tax=Amycolatopsis sp. NPDC059657 TaxID=3346899 RepID=UPI003672E6E5
MILITGATGTIGSPLTRILTSQDVPFRAMSRTPSQTTIQADFDDPASLARAVDGIDTVFLLTAPASPTPAHDFAMIEAAQNASVRKIVKLSAIGTGERNDDGQVVGAVHLRAEEAVRASGLEWTILRPSTFASNFAWWAGRIRAGEPVPNLTGDGRQGVVDPRDVAAVAAAALTEDGHSGRTYRLTGPELLSVPEQGAIIEKLFDRPVRTVDQSPAEARKQLPGDAAEMILAGAAWVRQGHNAIVTGDVPAVLGRPAGTFEDWARENFPSEAV